MVDSSYSKITSPTSEWESASWFRKWTFRVANGMIEIGLANSLQFGELMRLPSTMRSRSIVGRLNRNLTTCDRISFMPRLMVSLFKTYTWENTIIVFYAILEGATRIASPVILRFLLHSLQKKSNEAYIWAAVLSILNITQTIIHHVLFFYSMRMGWEWKQGVTALIFRNLFRLKSTVIGVGGGFGTGKLVNLISNDVSRFEEFSVFAWFFWVSYLELLAILLILIFDLNVASGFAGVGMTIVFIPIQVQLARQFALRRRSTAAATDQRVRFISEVIDGMSTVKSYGWEIPFYSFINKFRAQEMSNILQSQRLRAVNLGLYYFTPPVAAFATFAVFWGTGGTLTVPIVFSTVSLLLQLRTTIGRQWTRSIETGSEALASCQRIEEFFAACGEDCGAASTDAVPAVPSSATSSTVLERIGGLALTVAPLDAITQASPLLQLRKSSFFYGDDSSKPTLRDIEFGLRQGELVMVVGRVGAGKSSLLAATLGEMSAVAAPEQTNSESKDSTYESRGPLASVSGVGGVRMVQPDLRFSFCAQRPWILAGSVRSNIVIAGRQQENPSNPGTAESVDHVNDSPMTYDDFKNPATIDNDLYGTALTCCRIREDLRLWPDGDETEIGERGISISGGQKARLALARAVYSDADVHILDDVLSAVDAHVGRALFFDCIIGQMRNMGKSVLLATHQLQYLPYADRVLVLDSSGTQVFLGPFTELQARASEYPDLDLTGGAGLQQESDVGTEMRQHAQGGPNLGSRSAELNSDSIDEQAASVEQMQLWKDVEETEPVVADAATDNDSMETTETAKAVSSNFTPRENEDEINPSTVQLEENASPAPDQPAQTTNSMKESTTPSPCAVGLSPTNSPAPASVVPPALESVKGTIDAAPGKSATGVQAEDRVQGQVSMTLCWRYLKSGGSVKGIFALSVALLSQVLLMIADYWLRWWANSSFGSQRHGSYLWIYALLTAGCIFMGLYRAIIWFDFTMQAADSMHERALWSLLHTPLHFFVANPTGRILNRFSKDQNQIDEALPFTLFDFLQCFLFCIGTLVLVCVSIPWLVLLMPPLVYIFSIARNKYISSSREIKRLEATLRSPMYADFSATLEGLMTLRAYRLEHRVTASFDRQVDRNSRAWFSFLMVSRWLGFRLDLESSVVVVAVAFLSVILRDTVNVGLIGFALTYTLALSGLLQWTCRQSAEVETMMTSVERVATYGDLAPEQGYSSTLASYLSDGPEIPANSVTVLSKLKCNVEGAENMADTSHMPDDKIDEIILKKQGDLKVSNLTVRYRDDLSPVLHSISFSVPAGSKVGICGRTGSGKSSTLLALLRLNTISEGDILLDGESLLAMDLERARNSVSSIPQEPHLFSGTVRFNLDPFSVHSDKEIWAALKDAHIAEYISSGGLGLDSSVDEGGKNFSVGQRQLLSLARAILRRCPLVLMDEVTASIDYATDRLIQQTIRQSPSLRSSTIITVAHRLRTIADSDLIVVVQGGLLAEMGSPRSLLARTDSIFRSLAEESNEMDEISRLASLECDSVGENL